MFFLRNTYGGHRRHKNFAWPLVSERQNTNGCYDARIVMFLAMVFPDILGDMYEYIYIYRKDAINET